VLDFGIAVSTGAEQRNRSGLVDANARYVAPERIAEPTRPVAPACDVYSLAVLWYRMLTGRLPWNVATADELIEAHLNWEPDPIPDHVDLPARLKRLCLQCLSKHPSRRPTASAVAEALRGYRDVDVLDPDAVAVAAVIPADTLVERPPKRRRGLVPILLALLLATAFALWYLPGRGPGAINPHGPGGGGSATPTAPSSTSPGGGGSPGGQSGGPANGTQPTMAGGSQSPGSSPGTGTGGGSSTPPTASPSDSGPG